MIIDDLHIILLICMSPNGAKVVGNILSIVPYYLNQSINLNFNLGFVGGHGQGLERRGSAYYLS